MSKKILVVEDDEFFRTAVCDILRKKGFEIIEAPNGKVAREIMAVAEMDAVLTDVQMPGLSGVDLLEWAMTHKPVPFVMMTGFSMLLETQSAFELGAKEFLTKPFKNLELLAALDRVLKINATVEPEDVNQDGNFCKVSIDEFVSRSNMEFEVFVRLSENKYVKLAHRGDGLPAERMQHYREKGLKHLFIPKEDFGKLVSFNLNVASLINNRPEIPIAKRAGFLKHTGEVLLEKAFIKGVDRESFDEASSFMGMMMETITQSQEQFDILNMLNDHADYIYAHSLGVSLYSQMVAKQLGYQSSQTLFKLGMAGIYHDIGKKEIDREILDKPRAFLSAQERNIVESHVARGQQIINSIRSIPEDVGQLVYEHHEDCVGQGYPTHKPKKDLNQMSRILLTVNIFVEHAIRSPNHEGMEGAKAVEHIQKIYLERLDPVTMTALRQIFNLDPPKVNESR